MGDLKNIRPDIVTPKDVLDDLNASLGDLRQLYVVAITQKEGKPLVWAAGTLEGMAYAAVKMQAVTQKSMEDYY